MSNTSQTLSAEVRTKPVTVGATVQWGEHLVRRAAAEAVQYSDKLTRRTIEEVNATRQVIEDTRANHRNLNRMLTLFGALVIGMVLTYLLTHPVLLHSWFGMSPKTVKSIAPYTFVITVAMDSTLALYSFIRHY